MANNENVTIKFRADVTDLKNGISQANSDIKLANAQFKAASAGMDDWSKSSEGIKAKLSQLGATLNAEKTKLNAYKEQLERIKEAENKNVKSAEELRAKYQQAAATYGENSDEAKKYQKQLASVEKEIVSNQNAHEKLSVTILNQQAKVSNTEKEYKNFENRLGQVEKAEKEAEKSGRDVADVLDEMDKSADKAESGMKDLDGGFTVLKGSMANLVADGIKSLISGFKNLMESTRETRIELGKVETAFTTNGFSAEAAKKVYKDFYGILGDTGQATEAVNHLAKLTRNEEELATWTNICTGVYGTFGASLPIEGLTEAANETAKVAKVTGPLADALNWSTLSAEGWAKVLGEGSIAQQAFNKGISEGLPVEDAFNEALAVTSEEQDRQTLIMKTLNSMYDDASKKYKTVNGDIIESNKAQADLNDTMASVSKKIAPITTSLAQGFAKVLDKIVALVGESNLESWAKGVANAFDGFINSVLPAITAGFQWIIDNKGFIIGAINGIITAFAVVKIASFASAFSGVITAFTSAPTIIAGVTAAMKALNLTALANPYVALAAAIAGVVIGLGSWALASDETYQKIKKEKEEAEAQTKVVQENKKAWDDMTKSRQESTNSGLSELQHYQSLYDELNKIVDANGKVKDGYEGRASFITTTLKNALGIEIETVDGVVKNYQSLVETFDKVMEKKRAMIILEAQEASYKEAITEKSKLLQSQSKLQEELAEKTKQAQEKMTEALRANNPIQQALLMKEAYDLANTVKEKKTQYDTQQQQLEEFNTTIGIYEKNAALAHEERYNEMTTVDATYIQNLKDNNDTEKALLESQIEDEKRNLDMLLQQKKNSNSDIYDEQIKASEERLKQLQQDLQNQQSTVATGNDNVTKEWRNGIAEQLSAITGKKYEFRDAGDGQVAMYIDGVEAKEPVAEEEMKTFAQDMVDKLDKEKEAKEAGENIIDGVKDGVSNQNKQNNVFSIIWNFGQSILGNLMKSLSEHSPSKASREMGQYLLEGLGLGISDKENGVLKQVSDFGNSVISNLSGSLNKEVNLGTMKTNLSGSLNGMNIKGEVGSSSSGSDFNGGNTINFYQTNNSPKSLSRLDIYRQTKNALRYAAR